MATEKPYGDVDYADPGYQGDNKKRYPLDSEEHCRAAWSYINMPDNAAKYNPEQLAHIKKKVRAALKRYGVEVEASAEPPPEPQTTDPQAPDPSGASPSPAPVTAAEAARRIHAAATRPTNKEGAGHMDPAKIREALGLAPDVSDDEVKAALVTAGLAAPPADPTPQVTAAAAAPPGTMLVSESNWQQMQEQLKTLTSFVDQTKRSERDQVIAQAISDGKFTPAQKQHFANLWDSNPDGTRAVIASMQRNSAFAVEAMGYAGTEGNDFEHEYQQMVTQLNGRRG